MYGKTHFIQIHFINYNQELKTFSRISSQKTFLTVQIMLVKFSQNFFNSEKRFEKNGNLFFAEFVGKGLISYECWVEGVGEGVFFWNYFWQKK